MFVPINIFFLSIYYEKVSKIYTSIELLKKKN